MKEKRWYSLACGKHYTPYANKKGKKCSKCAYLAEFNAKYRQYFQAGGTPYIALIGEIVEKNKRGSS